MCVSADSFLFQDVMDVFIMLTEGYLGQIFCILVYLVVWNLNVQIVMS